ncbi:glycogen synthase GlgA [Tetragenococcus koreensis]|uniref:glycogen synthase GlgA n=1 Tax=Tetragenococcus koreensis TaxID=290335 RepID=UPI000F4F31C2|nr:glycogen synthase GlgA [Tetragenococcus koreensis]AYW45177.1 glycogen synthase GlgA [Tetragenococcus koreensis]MDN6664053.1 glycogen synthase GlgA [Tetragenococcus koreensis]GEN91274.1 glycogen synthase [Tetragenococcus koreensis]
MKLLFAAAECAPFFKTGGLGDVAGTLPKVLAKEGTETVVVLPYFTKMPDKYKNQLKDVFNFEVNVGWRKQYCGVKRLDMDKVTYYFIDSLYYFDREALYGYYDDGERFAFFQMAVIELMEKIAFIPDILQVNDYHTAMIPFLLKEKYHWIEAYRNIRTVLTIHNIQFQGQYGSEILPDLFGMGTERYNDGTLRLGDAVNFMKAGILYADRITTVSPSYAQEIQTPEFGCGLEVILRMEAGKLSGILNGIDYEANDPETDPVLNEHYSVKDLSGKYQNKADLQRLMGLNEDPEVPLLAVVSRLTYQKGFHLLLDEFENLLQIDIQFVLLGTGDPDFERGFAEIAQRYPGKSSVAIDFDVELAQKIYASSDLFLMPSAFEPCGLSQMIAMRYGTLPVVHEVGGLKDTVVPYNPVEGTGTGFGFQDFSSFQLMECIKKAIELYHFSPETWQKMVQAAMIQDFSWTTSCRQYLDLYQQLATVE